jgi:hypothetical protein
MLRRYWFRALVIIAVLGFVITWWITSAFNDRGYAPEQPIAFPHDRHAGDLQINCKYCHFNAERGKHAGVPPMSVCLGCHGPAGGNVAADKPGIKKLNEIAASGSYTDENGVVHDGGVVHWNRVHKLPDFVYFPHQWHIAAGVACQTCHGPVEKMPVVRQYATLTMSWCLDCHRKSNYVGGPGYQSGDPSTFTVGTANYAIVRARIKPDEIARFVPREVKGSTDQPAQEHVAPAKPTTEAERLVQSRPEWSAELREKVLKLPLWRVAELPESHRDHYHSAAEFEGKSEKEIHDLILAGDFMNSPTQCSTCHQ